VVFVLAHGFFWSGFNRLPLYSTTRQGKATQRLFCVFFLLGYFWRGVLCAIHPDLPADPRVRSHYPPLPPQLSNQLPYLLVLFNHHISQKKYDRPPSIFQKLPSTEVHYSRLEYPTSPGRFFEGVATECRQSFLEVITITVLLNYD
jgi:hypothetical protein